MMPAIFELVIGGSLPSPTERNDRFPTDLETMSAAVAIVLLVAYAAGLFFSLQARTATSSTRSTARRTTSAPRPWSVRKSVIALALAGVAVGVMSEILVGSIEEASEGIGLSPFFVAIIVVAIVGNAAEHWVAVYFARAGQDGPVGQHRDRLERPDRAVRRRRCWCCCSFFIGPFPMALVFNGLELGAILLAILIANHVTQEGESTWFEGVQLLAVYVVLGHRVLLRRMTLAFISGPGPWLALAGITVALLLVDLSCSRPDREPTFREGAYWSIGWLVVALAVAPLVWVLSSADDAVTYTTIYFVERSLSLDNLFVFLLLFSYFAVPEEHRANLLFWGIVAALVLRGAGDPRRRRADRAVPLSSSTSSARCCSCSPGGSCAGSRRGWTRTRT